ncbi:hypothetical protein CTI12_AA143840 [Artemisia annua]|uniref:Uncharacterized protein n=1 Tax=Artemisia annua TaxID=35608 RepID=A0A2U1PKK1_ARTAN|nr:hypothetical protein CTI12_AA143840 [Artemisia annua]
MDKKAIATLAAVLSPEDQETLAYLILTGNKPTSQKSTGASVDHAPQFTCNCFTCYTSFWARWDASPNRKKIHEIIDAYEDGLVHTKKSGKTKKERKPNKGFGSKGVYVAHALHAPMDDVERESHAPVQDEVKKCECEEEVVTEKGSVRKIFSFIGERIWGVWGV